MPPWKPQANAQNTTVIDAIASSAARYSAGRYHVVIGAIIGPRSLGALLPRGDGRHLTGRQAIRMKKVPPSRSGSYCPRPTLADCQRVTEETPSRNGASRYRDSADAFHAWKARSTRFSLRLVGLSRLDWRVMAMKCSNCRIVDRDDEVRSPDDEV